MVFSSYTIQNFQYISLTQGLKRSFWKAAGANSKTLLSHNACSSLMMTVLHTPAAALSWEQYQETSSLTGLGLVSE